MYQLITGHCLCGQLTYEYQGTVGPANLCHCEDCRRCTGSAFNVGVQLETAAFRITHGTLKSHTKSGESGTALTRYFCPECGSPIYTASPKHPESLYVKAGSLDDPSVVHVARQIWLDSAVPWRHIDPELPAFLRGYG